jgi:hypothetical protein
MSQLAREYIYILFVFRHQTICVEVINNLNKVISIINSQITKAHDYFFNHICFNLKSSHTTQCLYFYILIYMAMSEI